MHIVLLHAQSSVPACHGVLIGCCSSMLPLQVESMLMAGMYGACMQAKGWPACKKWTRGYLRKAFKGQNIVAGNYAMAFDDYLAYMDGASADEMPLYLFDCKFAAKAPSLAADYRREWRADRCVAVACATILSLMHRAQSRFQGCLPQKDSQLR